MRITRSSSISPVTTGQAPKAAVRFVVPLALKADTI
jgi:hypothetical protein